MLNKQATQRQKILILAAIPYGLRLDKEIREVEQCIRSALRRDIFEVYIRTAVKSQDIRRAIAEEKPQIVHFCGHGLEDGSLLLEDDEGNQKHLPPEGLAALFKLHKDYVDCVLLNACYSVKSAEAISKYINYAIGMNQQIQDESAIQFAQGYYDGLGYEASENQDVFQRAFEEGLVAIKLENLSQAEIPVMKTGINNGETVDIKSEYSKHYEGKNFTQCICKNVVLEMVYISTDKHPMALPETEVESHEMQTPQNQVNIQPFFMGKYPVTQAQWEAVARLSKVKRELNANPSQFKGDSRPVECICWDDAVEFCDRLSLYTKRKYRLPSEAEWEYACLAGSTTSFHFGEAITTELANYNGNYTYKDSVKGEFRQQTTPVGSFIPNSFGLYDMHGNIWEWCADTLGNNYQQMRPQRGGSWYCHPENCCSKHHHESPSWHYSINIGFRVVC